MGTLEDDRTVLYKTKSLDGSKPNTDPITNLKTNPNRNDDGYLGRKERMKRRYIAKSNF